MDANFLPQVNGLFGYPGEGEASAEAGSDGFGCAVGQGVPVVAPTYDPFRAFGPPATFSFGNNNNQDNNNNNSNHQQINHSGLNLVAAPGAAFAGGNLGLANDTANPQIIPQDLAAPLPDVFPPAQVNVGPIFFPQSPDDTNPFSAAFPAPLPNLVTFNTGTGTDFAAFGTGTGATQMPEHNQDNLFRSLGGVLNDFGGGVCPAFAPPRPATTNQNHLWINTAASNLNPTPSSSSTSAYATASVCDTHNPTALESPQSLPLLNSASFADPDNFAAANLGRTRDFNDDDFFAALVTGNFSSPSLPPHRSSSRQLSPLNYPSNPHQEQSDDSNNAANMPTRGTAAPVPRTAASERVRRASRSSVASMVDLTSPKTERASGSPAGVDAATPMAPPSTRKRSRANTAGSAQGAPSRRSSTSNRSRPVKPARLSRKTIATAVDDDDLFNDGSSVVGREDDEEVLDLTGANEVPAELLKPKVDNRVKLGKFQCVICMDDVSNLTVTHCGHLFCSECLHSSLHIDTMKKTCPVCRTKVDLKAKPGARQSKNSYFHLELKLMTANRKGKLPAGR